MTAAEQALHRSPQSGEDVAAAAIQRMKKSVSRPIWTQMFQRDVRERGPVVGIK